MKCENSRMKKKLLYKIDKFIENINKTLKSLLINIEAILINFLVHKEQSLFKITSCVSEIYNLASIDNSIDIKMLKYEIIISGL